MQNLIVDPFPKPGPDGKVLSITPASAGWTYVGFEVFKLEPGQVIERRTEDKEFCLVLISGKADVTAGSREWSDIGQRMSVFEKTSPYSVYVQGQSGFTVRALTALELGICSAPWLGKSTTRLIEPKQVGIETRGYGNIERRIHNILPENESADSLLIVEVFTPNGHWSSYPPHKHDRNALPEESLLEETYYFRVQPERGFAIQRVYTDDRSLDETLTVRNGQAVMVPRGYHPVGAPPGYDAYYLNVMAGPVRTWKFHNDPAHAWIMEKGAAGSTY